MVARCRRAAFACVALACLAEPTFARISSASRSRSRGARSGKRATTSAYPNETGTRFALVDTIGKGPFSAFRLEVAFNLNERHGFLGVVAPLEIEDGGALTEHASFAGQSFAPGVDTRATYKFSSYRAHLPLSLPRRRHLALESGAHQPSFEMPESRCVRAKCSPRIPTSDSYPCCM